MMNREEVVALQHQRYATKNLIQLVAFLMKIGQHL